MKMRTPKMKIASPRSRYYIITFTNHCSVYTLLSFHFSLFNLHRGTPNTKKRSATQLDDAIINLIGEHEKNRKKKVTEESDPLKMYFMAYYSSVRKLKVRNQLKLKRALNNILQDLEEEELESADNS